MTRDVSRPADAPDPAEPAPAEIERTFSPSGWLLAANTALGRAMEELAVAQTPYPAAILDGVHCIEDQVGQHSAKLRCLPKTRRRLLGRDRHFDRFAVRPCRVPPAWPRHFDRLLNEFMKVDRGQHLSIV